MGWRFRRRWENDFVRLSTVIVLCFLFSGILVWSNIPSPRSQELDRQFVYGRVAETHTMILYVSDEYPEWLRKALRIDHDSILDESESLYHSASEDERIPPVAALDWAVLFLKLGDDALARECLDQVGKIAGPPARQKELIEAMAGGTNPDPGIVVWTNQRFQEGKSDLPEWYFLAESEGNEEVLHWLEERGRHLVERGFVAGILGLLVVLGSIGSGGWFLVARKRLPPPSARMSLLRGWNVRMLIREFCLGELLAVAISIPAGLLLSVVPYDWSVLIGAVLFIVIPGIWLVYRMTPGPRAALRLFGLVRSPWPKGKMTVFGLLSVSWLIVEVLILLAFDTGDLSLEDAIRPEFLDRPFALVNCFLIAVILAPVFEELVFRGFLFGGLKSRMGGWGAASLTSTIFALLHGYSVIGLLATFGYGMVFCWLYARSGSLWPGIVAHAVFNLVVSFQVVGWYSLY